jgi:hypothetical protein
VTFKPLLKTILSEKKRLGRMPTRQEFQVALNNAPMPSKREFGLSVHAAGAKAAKRNVPAAALANKVSAPKAEPKISAPINAPRKTAVIKQPLARNSTARVGGYYTNDNLVSDESAARRRRRRRSA